MPNQAYVYRLTIVYPEGSQNGTGYQPYHWDSILRSMPRDVRRKARKTGFRWPRERMFLSSSAAYQRAGWLQYLGAKVTIERSFAVEWPDRSWMQEA